jgi:hypothetical protein
MNRKPLNTSQFKKSNSSDFNTLIATLAARLGVSADELRAMSGQIDAIAALPELHDPAQFEARIAELSALLAQIGSDPAAGRKLDDWVAAQEARYGIAAAKAQAEAQRAKEYRNAAHSSIAASLRAHGIKPLSGEEE